MEERYCSHCGQENTEPKESIGHLIGHFIEDVTHFDSKLFTTLKDLVLRPGFLTREYVAGRRVQYLNPIRMYIFISAVFFLVLFAGRKEEGTVVGEGHAVNLFRQRVADSLRDVGGVSPQDVGGESLRGKGGSGLRSEGVDSVRRRVNQELAASLDTVEKGKAGEESMFFSAGAGGKIVIDLVQTRYHSLREYDSLEPHLPDSLRHTGFWGWVARRNMKLKEEHGGRGHIRIEKDLEHTIPKLMFVFLPLFALYTGWFYSRRKYYYVQHAIFSIHFHSFAFLIFLVLTLVSLLGVSVGLVMGGYLLVFAYLVAALRGMYGQSWGLSLVKGILVSVLYAVTIGLSMWVLAVVAILQA
ncbi:DUF3667 domain-containing protein [Puia sp. P3]|uniref:DUF3667 domain-containing protein n=1 Tax=Puia sp. P3 TaxID=3423952 RepID=UPI003D66D34B